MVPTLYVMNYIVEEGEAIGFPRESIEKARALMEERDRRIGEAFAAGVPVAFGSDTIFPHETAAREFAVMVGLGLSPTDALRSAMTVPARVLGLEDEIGRIQPGFAADVIAVEGNPLENIRVMEDVRFVMRAGKVVKAP